MNEDDVGRIVHRDYPTPLAYEILEMIATVEVREKPRVVLACLKIADGQVDRLRTQLARAVGDWREVLSQAEYPLATKRWSRIRSLPDEEVSAIYEKDWQQYSEWLRRA